MSDLDPNAGKGPIAWMARNNVAANLLMVFFIVGGLIIFMTVKQEVFPEFDMDIVNISVPYPGASPDEVQEGIILAIEEEVESLDGIKRITANASEGLGFVNVELLRGTNPNKALQDIKNAIDRIQSFPEEAEREQVQLLSMRREVITLILYGNQSEKTLRKLAETVRSELLLDPGITQADVAGTRTVEITVAVSQETLRRYNLTLDQIALKIRRTALDLPAGSVKTRQGEILLRTTERRELGREFENIVIVGKPDGTEVKLRDMADIIDGFTDNEMETYYNGLPAAMVRVYRVGDQTPQSVAQKVKAYIDDLNRKLPGGVKATVLNDWSEILYDRMMLLLKNFILGLVLVLLLLGMFLEPKLAFWVMMGIPISIFGSFLFIRPMDVSINMISLFAFIVTLGIIVDDAIIVGENTYEYRQRGMDYLKSAIDGTRYVTAPVTFSILTNIAAFCPMLFVPGISGKFYRVIPVTVIAVFVVSWLECLFVLPSHLAHQKPRKKKGPIMRFQGRVANLLNRFRDNVYEPLFRFCIRFRYLTIAVGLAVLALTVGFVAGGHIDLTHLPKIDGDRVTANAALSYGIPFEETRKVQEKLVAAARQVAAQYPKDTLIKGIFSLAGGGIDDHRGGGLGTHLASVQVFLTDTEVRPLKAHEFTKAWRKLTAGILGLESLAFTHAIGGSPGSPIHIQLSHDDPQKLERGATELADIIRNGYPGVKDVDDGYAPGKRQLNLKITSEAQSLGLDALELGRQARSFYYGAEALRQQRGRDEIKVMVKLPRDQRRSELHLENLLIRTPGGGEIPFSEAAHISWGRAYTVIRRADRKQILNVTADVEKGVANAEKVLADLKEKVLPGFMEKHPGLTYSLEGEQREQRDTNKALTIGFILAMLCIYAMLAIPFKSYVQPVIIMISIPFGIVGATLGHIIMGYDLSLISMMGIVALAGVVVNDSLVLIDYANRKQRQGQPHREAIHKAGIRRFRPVILTSVTTFMGLAPMIFETSIQARFLIPMAISLGFGILFATAIALLLVPALYLAVEDGKAFLKWYLGHFGFFK